MALSDALLTMVQLPVTLRGTPGFMRMEEDRDLEECCKNCDPATNVSTIRIAAWKNLAVELESIAKTQQEILGELIVAKDFATHGIFKRLEVRRD